MKNRKLTAKENCPRIKKAVKTAFQELNTPGMIRTCDLLIRSQALYPAELRVRKASFKTTNLKLSCQVERGANAVVGKRVCAFLFRKISLTSFGNQFGVIDLDFYFAPFTVAFIVG